MKRNRQTTYLFLVALVLAPALLWAGGCSVNPVTGRKQLTLITRDQEIAMGKEAAPQFEKEFGGRVTDPALQGYVQSVGQKMAAKSHRQMPYEYVLVASAVPNAFALPGGSIFLTAGLMRRMTNERQLAAVLGHETGHVAAMHNVQGMQRQIMLEVGMQILAGTEAQKAEGVARLVGSMMTLRYSRGDEYEADKVGIEYMTRAGYNPWGMVELLEVLQGLSESEPGTLAEMFQTHPVTSKRIAEVKGIIEREQASADRTAADPNAAKFMAMRKRLPAAVGK